jgi:hypothetical protein
MLRTGQEDRRGPTSRVKTHREFFREYRDKLSETDAKMPRGVEESQTPFSASQQWGSTFLLFVRWIPSYCNLLRNSMLSKRFLSLIAMRRSVCIIC